MAIDTAALRPGARLGDFELTEYLTAGGMADLWLARSPRFAGPLALKLVQSRYRDDDLLRLAFHEEGWLSLRLEHPNVVRTVDAGEIDGVLFLAMQYIDGRDLISVCRRGLEVGRPLSRALAAAVVAQAARGLAYAHELHHEGQPLCLVHRDVSPGNLMLSWGGTVRVVDFGVARMLARGAGGGLPVAGKLAYMAPEQIRAEAIDARADVFALGVILWELTLGRRLFRGRPEQVMHRVLREPIAAPRALVADYPAALEAIVLSALARERERRLPSARMLAGTLADWLRAAGAPHDKRALAEHLRAIFHAPKLRDADDFDGDDAPARALPAADAPLVIDPDDDGASAARTDASAARTESSAAHPNASEVGTRSAARRRRVPPWAALLVAALAAAALACFLLCR